MDEYLIQGSTLTDIADAIREKTGDSALMTPAEMVEAIEGISGGGGEENTGFEIIDFVQDNATASTKNIHPQKMFDNFVVQYGVLETGTYTNGVLQMDDQPTIPTNRNIPFLGTHTFLSRYFSAPVYVAGAPQSYAMRSAYAIVRASITMYGSSNPNARGTNYLQLKTHYPFGATGKYIKYRCYVFGWNNPEEG